MKRLLLAAPLAAIPALWLLLPDAAPTGPDADTIALGRQVYAANCASCHGAELEGQPDWGEPLPNGRYPAPPHDASGHTWHHPDALHHAGWSERLAGRRPPPEHRPPRGSSRV